MLDDILYNQIIFELKMDSKYDIKGIKSIINIYGKYHNNKKQYKNTNILVSSKLITSFLKKIKFKNIPKLKENYSFNDSITLISNLTKNLYHSQDSNIINTLDNLIILLYKDYLKSKSLKYKKIVLASNNFRSKQINDKLKLLSKRVKLIELYNKNKLNKENILKYIDNNLIDYIILENINEEYNYLFANLLCDLIYNDKNNYDLFFYLIDLSNNTKDINNLFFSKLLNISDCKLNNNFTYKLVFPILFFTSATILFTLNISSITSLNRVCDKDKYNKEEALFCFNQILDGEIIKDGVTKEQLDILNDKIVLLDDEIKEKLNSAYKQLEEMENINKKIDKLLLSDTLVKDNVTIKDRFDLYNELIKVSNKNFVEEKMKYIDLIDEFIDSKDVIELTNVPFVSQKEAKIYNGCEAASLLMALKYKKVLLDYDLKRFVEEMPKATDPHQGFIYSIYSYEPKDVVHWIAPDALNEFASKYSLSSDISGSSVDELKRHIRNNEPVIVYVTSEFKDAYFTSFEVPLNLHVVLLVGYNQIDGSYIIIDPYYGRLEIEKEIFEKSYNNLKYAVTVY